MRSSRQILWQLIMMVALLCLHVNARAEAIAYVSAATLNVRAEPGGDVTGTLVRGRLVVVMTIEGDWAHVQYVLGAEIFRGWVAKEYLFIHSGSSSSRVCETELRSGTEVCIEVKGSDISCDEDYRSTFYDDCEVSVRFELETDYRGQTSLEVAVEIAIEIEYQERNSGYWSSDTETYTKDYTVRRAGKQSELATVEFSFGSYRPAVEARVGSVNCKIKEVELR